MEIFSIHTVERETGLTKDALRKWESRYGFPLPDRHPNGERFYTQIELDRLLNIKKLIEQGYKPGYLVPLSPAELTTLTNSLPKAESLNDGQHQTLLTNVWEALRRPDQGALLALLGEALATCGLKAFVLEIMPPLNKMVGSGWVSGELSVHQEHLYTVCIRDLIIRALGNIQTPADGPRVLLSTPPEEYHELGMLMLQTILTLSGARCISLGASTPVTELVKAAISHKVDIVSLSISVSFPTRRIKPLLEKVRQLLPANIELWTGGSGIANLRRKLGSTRTFNNLEMAIAAISKIKTKH